MEVKNLKNQQIHKCMYCNAAYEQNELYCANCGFLLPHVLGEEANQTRSVTNTGGNPLDLQWGTGYFHHRAKLFLRIEDTDTVFPVPIATPSVILGRKGEGESAFVDLTPYGAADLGVSRRHVRIERARDILQVIDLQSANGTYLNRDRLIPGSAYTLRNRAVLQLGKMILRIQFA
jgi:pSer/pThr/pTyr-binding forkhead associated (FHA) protein